MRSEANFCKKYASLRQFFTNIVDDSSPAEYSRASTHCSEIVSQFYRLSASILFPRRKSEYWFRSHRRGVAQPGSASGLGLEGRRFESYHPDHFLFHGGLPQWNKK